MQNLDPKNLFSIFEQGDEQVYQEHNVQELLQNPYVLMGMVLRGLENFQLMDLMYTRNYPKEYKLKRPEIRYKYYNKLFSYLERIDWSDDHSVYKVGTSYDLIETSKGLNEMIYYYEKLEHYEKCAVLKNCLDLLYGVEYNQMDIPK